MKYIKLISLIGLFSILLTSCGKKSKLGKLIPKEAAVIVDLNAKSLLSKLPWDEIKQTYWYNELMADSSFPATAKLLMIPSSVMVPFMTGMAAHLIKQI